MAEHEIGDQMSNLMKEKVREVKADGLSGNVKVLSRRALMDIVDQLIKAYGGLENGELISKIAQGELEKKQLETQIASLSGKLEIIDRQGGELRKENAEFLAKVKAAEARMPLLEEQNVVFKKTVEGLEATAENLKAKLAQLEEGTRTSAEQAAAEIAALKARIAEVEPKLAEAQALKADVERRIKEKDDYIGDLQNKVDEAVGAREKAVTELREKIARLEKALQQSDARKRILELENEVSDLRGNVQALEQGLEFLDAGPAPKFDDVELELMEVEEALGKFPSENKDADPLRKGCKVARAAITKDRAAWDKLTALMYDQKGSISVACDLAKIGVRQESLRDHLRTLLAAAALL
jgi:chromosome segregation ATPase